VGAGIFDLVVDAHREGMLLRYGGRVRGAGGRCCIVVVTVVMVVDR
jgi:hypothetical protein